MEQNARKEKKADKLNWLVRSVVPPLALLSSRIVKRDVHLLVRSSTVVMGGTMWSKILFEYPNAYETRSPSLSHNLEKVTRGVQARLLFDQKNFG